MQFLRNILILMLAISLPVDALASVSMSQCKDMQAATSNHQATSHDMPSMDHEMAGHDHAAMMAMDKQPTMDAGGAHDHHSMSGSSESKDKPQGFGCQCGCKCSGNCAVGCASMLIAIAISTLPESDDVPAMLAVPAPRGQAHAAYRFDPLRPPSAVAL